ncbi:MAG: AbrB/MazE/SpoVT family DNA-binding domain-containing protein [Archaeoglobaceae archaeon]
MKSYKVHESGGQLKVTIPVVLAESMGIKKGDNVRWKIDRGHLVLEKIE